MADQSGEYSVSKEVKNRAGFETGVMVKENPDHPTYSADRGVSKELVHVGSAVLAAIDGMTVGGNSSEEAAELMQKNLYDLETQVMKTPTVEEGKVHLKNAIFGVRKAMQEGKLGSQDVTVCAGIVCEAADGQSKTLVIANLGQNLICSYNPNTGEVTQLTRVDTAAQSLVSVGKLTQEEALTNPNRFQVYRSVRGLKAPKDIPFTEVAMKEGEVYIAMSDGFHGNIHPREIHRTVQEAYRSAYDKTQNKPDMHRFASNLADKAIIEQTTPGDENRKSRGDTCVAVLRYPRSKPSV